MIQHPKEYDMGKLTVTEFATLDGVGQAPGQPEEDGDSNFAYGGWQAPLIDQKSGAAMFDQAKDMDALLLGRKTYEIFAGYWPRAPEEIPFTGLLNSVPKYVASRTRTEDLAWQGSTILSGDLATNINDLKHRYDEIHVIGSLNLVQSLLSLGLVDRFNLWLYPLLLGSGGQVFGDGTLPTALRLTESVTYSNGTLQLTYETAGVPTFGNMAIEADDLQRLSRSE